MSGGPRRLPSLPSGEALRAALAKGRSRLAKGLSGARRRLSDAWRGLSDAGRRAAVVGRRLSRLPAEGLLWARRALGRDAAAGDGRTASKSGDGRDADGGGKAPAEAEDGGDAAADGDGKTPAEAEDGGDAAADGDGKTPAEAGDGGDAVAAEGGRAPTEAGDGRDAAADGGGQAPAEAGDGRDAAAAEDGRAATESRGRRFWTAGSLSMRLYIGIGGAVALTLTASVVAWFSLLRIDDAQSGVTDSIPGVVTAFLLAGQGNSLAAAAPRLVAATGSEDLERVRVGVATDRELFEQRLDELLALREGGEDIDAIRRRAESLALNIQAIESLVEEDLTLRERSERVAVELANLQLLLERQLAEAIDDQFFYTVTGYRERGRPSASTRNHFNETEFHRFRYLMELQQAGNLGTQILASVFNISDVRQLEPLRERFEASSAKIGRNIGSLEDSGLLNSALIGSFDRLRRIGLEAEGGFALQVQALSLTDRQEELLAANRELAGALGTEIETQLGGARERSLAATRQATRTSQLARNLLLWIVALAVVGAFGIGWFYVHPLVGRIKWLSERMRAMAGGELQTEVSMSGRDEVAEMAAALEGFRRSALEAQRLNLVEKLAEELRGKNEELEKVLGELRHAQDQIVMREKLAALGELTAGVAHEIKNPLNFVKNFSEGAIEVLDEMKELIKEADGELSKEQCKTIQEIGEDLSENLSSILRNGERANRIVQDMLSMGRGSGEPQPVDINGLLEEHANLAYHAARATDPDFQLTIRKDLDPNAGEITVVPHDLGRVFLNIVGNACHATDEKRRKIEEETGARLKAGEGYEPAIEIGTRRDAEAVTVTVRDNGCGIPDDLVEKVFNPFFTTKPPDKGTGLGLSLSNDIVVEHGGAISVESEAGEYTEMRIRLPLKSELAARAALEDEDVPDGEPARDGTDAPGRD